MLKQTNLEVNNFGALNAVKEYSLEPGTKITKSGTEHSLVVYVTNGKYSYTDNIGNTFNLGRGEVQSINPSNEIDYTITNGGEKELTFITFEISGDGTKTEISSEAQKYKWKLRINQWLEVVSSLEGEADIRVNQDVKIHVLMLDSGLSEGFAVDGNRIAHLIQLEGNSEVNGVKLESGNGLAIDGEDIMLTAINNSHLVIFETKK